MNETGNTTNESTENDNEADVQSEYAEGDRVIVRQTGAGAHTVTGTIDEINPKENGMNGVRFEYVVDLDGSGHAHVTADVLLGVDELENQHPDPTGDDAKLIVECGPEGTFLEQKIAISRGPSTTLSVKTGDDFDGLVGVGLLPELARNDYVAVDVDHLEEIVELAKARIDDDCARYTDVGDIPGYSLDDAIEAHEDLREAVDRANDKRDGGE